MLSMFFFCSSMIVSFVQCQRVRVSEYQRKTFDSLTP
jgi:hypothetical protein